MNKTLRQDKIELLTKAMEALLDERVGHDIYGTTKEDAFLSGINEGISRCHDRLQSILDELEEQHG